MKTQIQLWEILVPSLRGDPKKRMAHHKAWDKQVYGIAGGLTIFKSVKGQWASCSGKVYNERMIPVRIACTEEQIEEIMDMTAKHYDQKAVMVNRISDCVKFYYSPSSP